MKIIILILSTFVYATTINIPGDYPTIQEGIDAAVDGDIVLVATGVYTENLLIESGVTLLSVDGANSTVIDGISQTLGNLGFFPTRVHPFGLSRKRSMYLLVHHLHP